MIKNPFNSGETIIEIIIATAVVTLVMTAVMSGMTFSIKNTAQSKYKTLGTKLAQDGLEVFRRERDLMGWSTFYNSLNNGVYCFAILPENLSEFSAGDCDSTEVVLVANNEFVRQANVQKDFSGSDTLKATVTVSWGDGNQDHQTVVAQEFHNWD